MFRSMRLAPAVAVCIAALTVVARMQSPTPPDVNTLGPQIGDKVPDFRLTDQRGEARTLASLVGPNGLVLVFSRSADW